MSDPNADHVFEEIYEELRRLASSWGAARAPGSTLQPTALVHEAYLKVAQADELRWKNEDHFHAIAAKAMRQALITHHRGKNRQKRGGDWDRITLSGIPDHRASEGIDLIALDRALTELEKLNEIHARLSEYRFFAGMTTEAIARLLAIPLSDVKREWRIARAWLLARVTQDESE